MPLPAYRAKQSTDTTGTGSLVLNAASTTGRSLNAVYGGSARRVQYVISWATGFEIGLGDFDGGSPGALTRSTVLASSNAGTLVSLPAGTKDVFVALQPGQREILTVSATASVTLPDFGSVVVFTGASDATLGFPAYATVPPGASLLVINRGTAALILDGSGAETLNGVATLAVYPGESCEVMRDLTGWSVGGLPTGWRLLASSVSSSTVSSVVFGLPTSIQRYRLEIEDFTATASAFAFLRFSFDAGATYAAGSTDYGYSGAYLRPAAVASMGASAPYFQLSDTVAIGGDAFGHIEFKSTGKKRVIADTTVENTTPLYSRLSVGGRCGIIGTASHVLLGYSSTTISGHRVRLLGIA